MLILQKTGAVGVVADQIGQRGELPPANVVVAQNRCDPKMATAVHTKERQRIGARLPLTLTDKVRSLSVEPQQPILRRSSIQHAMIPAAVKEQRQERHEKKNTGTF